MDAAVPTLAVSVIYCIWSRYSRYEMTRRRRLCERLAFLLWCAADRLDAVEA
jgi:hypothetical protein